MKSLSSVLLTLLILNIKSPYASDAPDGIESSVGTSISKAAVTGVAVYIGTEMGRNWAVDLTSKVIRDSVKNPSFLFNWTVGSAIRGRSLLEAIPIAEKSGAKIGAITASVCTPLAIDFTIHAASSWEKVGQYLNERYLEDKKDAKKPSRKDVLMVGSNIAIFGGIIGILINALKS